MATFWGYVRPDGTVGVRNHLAIIPSVICANTVVQRIAQLLPGAVALPHPHGCAQIGDDVTVTERTLAAAAASPNVGAALIVGLGCETCQADDVAQLATQLAPGKLIESMYIQHEGGSIKTIQRGVDVGRDVSRRISLLQREEVPLAELTLAIKCSDGDAASASNWRSVLDVLSDLLLAERGSVITARTSGEEEADVVPYATRQPRAGRVIMDTPGHDVVSITGMVCGGAQVCVLSSDDGSPLGHAIAPVIKVTSNPETARRMEDNIDFLAASAAGGAVPSQILGQELFRLLLEVSNGRLTSAELIGHQEFALHRIGPTV